MEEYKRLTKRFRNSQMQPDVELMATVSEGVYRLAELEDKIENGTLIELPCKVGDIVYGFVFEIEPYIEQYSVVAIEIGRETYLRCFEGKRGFVYLRSKSIFLTKAEAEKKLKELQNER